MIPCVVVFFVAAAGGRVGWISAEAFCSSRWAGSAVGLSLTI